MHPIIIAIQNATKNAFESHPLDTTTLLVITTHIDYEIRIVDESIDLAAYAKTYPNIPIYPSYTKAWPQSDPELINKIIKALQCTQYS